MKNVISNLAAAIIVGGAFMASQSAWSQVTANTLYLGFQNQNGGGSADYIINLGAASGIVGGSSVVNLSSDFSLSSFNNSQLVGTNSTTIVGGVVGGSNGGSPSTVYVTELRSGGAGSPPVPGSSAPVNATRSQLNQAYGAISLLAVPAAGTGSLDSTRSWENNIEPTDNGGTFIGVLGDNPDSSVATNTVLYEDLWFCANSSLTGGKSFAYEGYFTITPTGGVNSLTFTPSNTVASLTSPRIVSIAKTGNTVTLVWTTVATHTYQLQSTIAIMPTNWVNVGSSHVASFSFMTNSDTSATQNTKFYRVTGQ